jgi:hypothetical protein
LMWRILSKSARLYTMLGNAPGPIAGTFRGHYPKLAVQNATANGVETCGESG